MTDNRFAISLRTITLDGMARKQPPSLLQAVIVCVGGLIFIQAVLYAHKAGWFNAPVQAYIKDVTDDMMAISAKQRERQEAKLHELRMNRAAEKAAKPKGSQSPQYIGTVASVRVGDKQRDENLNGRLHFCVFDNGKRDFIYVGTKFGMWSNGKFVLTVDGKKIFTGEVPHLVYGGATLQMGNVLNGQPKSNAGVEVTRVEGVFK